MSILNEIVENTRLELHQRQKKTSQKELLKQLDKYFIKPASFKKSLQQDKVNIIAEVKKASPSKGVICENFDPAVIATEYAAGGAAAISVLTDAKYFQGSLNYLDAIAKHVKVPLLRKDFVIDEYMIYEAALHGASAVLLIAAVLTVEELQQFRGCAEALGLDALVEVHDNKELQKAIDSGAKIIGVNNRDLQTFVVSLDTSLHLAAQIPAECVRVSESGIFTAKDIQCLSQAGFQAFLIGESLMRMSDRIKVLKELRGEHAQSLR